MCERKVIGVSLLFFAFILLTTCQLQLNKAGNGFTLRVLIPGNASDGIKSTPTLASNAKDLSGGTSVTVTIITQTGSTWASSGLISIGGKTSVDYSVVLPPPGVYQVSAQLLDGSGNVISQASTTFTVPSQTNLVVLTMTSAAPLGGGIQLAWSANVSGPFTAITNGDYSVRYRTCTLQQLGLKFTITRSLTPLLQNRWAWGPQQSQTTRGPSFLLTSPLHHQSPRVGQRFLKFRPSTKVGTPTQRRSR